MKKYFRWFCLLALLLSIVICSFASGQESKEKEISIGFVTYDLTVSYQRMMIEAAQKKADELGIKLIVLSSDWDATKHLNVIDNFITMGVDGFISGSDPDPSAVIPGIKKLNEAGIPVIDLDNGALGGKVDYYIGFDIKESSAKAAEMMMQELKSRNNGQIPSGVVIEVMGELIEGFASECSKGFHSVIDQYKELKVIQGDGQWNNDSAFNVVSDFLTRFGDEVVAIYVHTPDCMGVGTVNAIKAAGMDTKKMVLTGICIGPEGIELLKKGEVTSIVEQPIGVSAEMAVELLNKIITKQPGLPKIGDTIIQEGAVWSPAAVIESPYADGAYIKLTGPLVPQEVLPDDPRLWENMPIFD
jgi:ribose transport system substrate-binding protein